MNDVASFAGCLCAQVISPAEKQPGEKSWGHATDNNHIGIYFLCSYDEEEECVNQYECQPLENLEKIEIGNLYFLNLCLLHLIITYFFPNLCFGKFRCI